MSALLAGIDISSRQLDACLIPLDPSARPTLPVHCIWRSEPLPSYQEVGMANHARAVSEATHSLLADIPPRRQWSRCNGFEIVQVWVEEPYTRSWMSGKPLIGTCYGVLASVPAHIERCEMAVSEWRSTLGLPGNLSKEAAIRYTCDLTGFAPAKVTEHMADAYLVAIGGRKKQWAASA